MSKEEFVFARPPNELSCIIGSLFAELNTPCEHICNDDEIVPVSYTHLSRAGENWQRVVCAQRTGNHQSKRLRPSSD